jgi:hypothetical protein
MGASVPKEPGRRPNKPTPPDDLPDDEQPRRGRPPKSLQRPFKLQAKVTRETFMLVEKARQHELDQGTLPVDCDKSTLIERAIWKTYGHLKARGGDTA